MPDPIPQTFLVLSNGTRLNLSHVVTYHAENDGVRFWTSWENDAASFFARVAVEWVDDTLVESGAARLVRLGS